MILRQFSPAEPLHTLTRLIGSMYTHRYNIFLLTEALFRDKVRTSSNSESVEED